MPQVLNMPAVVQGSFKNGSLNVLSSEYAKILKVSGV